LKHPWRRTLKREIEAGLHNPYHSYTLEGPRVAAYQRKQGTEGDDGHEGDVHLFQDEVEVEEQAVLEKVDSLFSFWG
jgi:hypothetical protein